MKCLICDATDKWENVDKYRLKQTREKNGEIVPVGMSICNSCGFVSYPSLWKSEEEIKKHYRHTYRGAPPTSNNLYSGQRKIHFHTAFLSETLQAWEKAGLKNPVILESGAAIGLVLHWLKQLIPQAQVYGTELTTTYRRIAKHEFNIDLTEDVDFSKKYDLIISYKVLEHQLDADIFLRKCVESLSSTGLVYISVPMWFECASDFGKGGFDLEYYYDTNHVNVWTRNNFESLLTKCGLEIIKQDHEMYDSTYLCKRNDELMKSIRVYDKPEKNIELMDNMKKAYLAFLDQDYEKAVSLFPNYPVAWVNMMEKNRKAWFAKGWQWILDNPIKDALAACNESPDILILAAELAIRNNEFKSAIKFTELALKKRPEAPAPLMQLITIMRELALRSQDPAERNHYFVEARKISQHLKLTSLQHARESQDFIFQFAAQVPIEGEA